MDWKKERASERREQRRREAEERQAEHDGLVAFDKLNKIAGRPGESKRERERVLATV